MHQYLIFRGLPPPKAAALFWGAQMPRWGAAAPDPPAKVGELGGGRQPPNSAVWRAGAPLIEHGVSGTAAPQEYVVGALFFHCLSTGRPIDKANLANPVNLIGGPLAATQPIEKLNSTPDFWGPQSGVEANFSMGWVAARLWAQ